MKFFYKRKYKDIKKHLKYLEYIRYYYSSKYFLIELKNIPDFLIGYYSWGYVSTTHLKINYISKDTENILRLLYSKRLIRKEKIHSTLI